jgi:hypothetical protein
MMRADIWNHSIVIEMTPEDKFFYLYILTNPQSNQIGIYKITKKQLAFDLGFSAEIVRSIMDRFTDHYKLIRYNPGTSEIAIKTWGKYYLHKAGKQVMECVISVLNEVKDHSLIRYVAGAIYKPEIYSLYDSSCKLEEMFSQGIQEQITG